MEQRLNISLAEGRKAKIALDTFHAIQRAIPIMACDERVAAYAGGRRDGVTGEVVAVIRRRMKQRGQLPARAFSRRGEAAANG